MPTLLCTSKYRRTFGLPERLEPGVTPEGALGPWYANTLNIGRLRFLHYMSTQALLSVVITLKERQSAEQRFVRSLMELLHALGIPTEWILKEAHLLGLLQYGRATNR